MRPRPLPAIATGGGGTARGALTASVACVPGDGAARSVEAPPTLGTIVLHVRVKPSPTPRTCSTIQDESVTRTPARTAPHRAFEPVRTIWS